MQPAVLIRLRPSGPWRYGAGESGQDGIDALYRSDRLFSALTLAAKQLGWLEEWLEATARSTEPIIACSSLFPFQGDTLFAPPPASLWPPPPSLITSPSPVFLTKVRWSAARFVPVSLIESILLGQKVLADQWVPDPESGCLLRRDRPSTQPFRTGIKTGAAVDRLTSGSVQVYKSACVEFESTAGLWTVIRYRSEEAESQWSGRLKAAMRLLSDTGFGGRRSVGWGQAQAPEFEEGEWPGVFLPKLGRALRRNAGSTEDTETVSSFWLLSLFSPGTTDSVEWSSGNYTLVERGGYVDSIGVSTGIAKRRVRMVAEGSVLAAKNTVSGTAVDVAPEAFAHPVYRSGIALALRLPIWQDPTIPSTVETPTDPEALEPSPCEEQSGNVEIQESERPAGEAAEAETDSVDAPAEATSSEATPAAEELPPGSDATVSDTAVEEALGEHLSTSAALSEGTAEESRTAPERHEESGTSENEESNHDV